MSESVTTFHKSISEIFLFRKPHFSVIIKKMCNFNSIEEDDHDYIIERRRLRLKRY